MKHHFTKVALLTLMTLSAACKDKDDDEDKKHDEGEAAAPECQAITDACHTVDDGKGEIYTCHSVIAHENVAAKCAEEKDRCVALCVAAGGGGANVADAGHGDAAH
jgi:hypothetical protein